MAVNINTVYQTVLFILNKEQRGYVPPGEFNSLAAQVQREIFESYFPDGNQINRANQNNTQNDTEFFNIPRDIQDKITPFEQEVQLSLGPDSTFTRPQVSDTGSVNRSIRKFGSIISTYIGQPTYESITQRTTKGDYNKIVRSKLTSPTKQNPIYYSYKGTSTSPYLKINPLPDSVLANCIVYPSNPIWNFTPGSSGQYIYSSFNSVDFELDSSEQNNIIMHILKYCGVIINNPTVIQTAAQDIQQTTINEKS